MRLILVQPQLHANDTVYNCEAIESLIARVPKSLSPEDLLLLPEHFSFDDDAERYYEFLRSLAGKAGCTVIGGSHHRSQNGAHVNAGSVVDPGGKVLGSYTKLRPYFREQSMVVPGEGIGEFALYGKQVLILICADFWYSDIFLGVRKLPDLVVVPSLSVSRKTNPRYSRSLWKHLAITRAYEFGVYAGISDWAADSTLPEYHASGVGGFADPTATDPEELFHPVGNDGYTIHEIDQERLDAFRADRRMRGFFWK